MAAYVQLGDVNTWYDQHGEGEPLVLLHPGGADARAFTPNIDALAARFHVFTPERRGHGHTPDVDGPITYELMATEGAAAFLAAGYGEVSPDGPEHFPVVAAKLARMHSAEPTLTTADLTSVTSRTLVMVGDDDEVTLEHTIALYRGLPNAEPAIVPGSSHGLLVEKPWLCNTHHRGVPHHRARAYHRAGPPGEQRPSVRARFCGGRATAPQGTPPARSMRHDPVLTPEHAAPAIRNDGWLPAARSSPALQGQERALTASVCRHRST